MNRREFLKVLGAGIVCSCLPSTKVFTALARYPYFDPSKEYGGYVQVTSLVDKVVLEASIEILDETINDCIPPQYRSKVEYTVNQPKISQNDPLGQFSSVGWKYSPNKTSTNLQKVLDRLK